MRKVLYDLFKTGKYYDKENDEIIELQIKRKKKIKVIQKNKYYFYNNSINEVYIKKNDKYVKTRRIAYVSDLVKALDLIVHGEEVRYKGCDYLFGKFEYGIWGVSVKKYINDKMINDIYNLETNSIFYSEIYEFDKTEKTKIKFLNGKIEMITKTIYPINKDIHSIVKPIGYYYYFDEAKNEHECEIMLIYFLFGKTLLSTEAKKVFNFLNNESYDNFKKLNFYSNKKKLFDNIKKFHIENNIKLDKLNEIEVIYKLEGKHGWS